MAGVGITAAIGFVFALTVLNSNNNPIDTGTDNPEVAQRLETQPNEALSFFFEQQQQQRGQEPIADGGQQTGDASVQSKERDQAAGSDLSQQEMTILQQEATDL